MQEFWSSWRGESWKDNTEDACTERVKDPKGFQFLKKEDGAQRWKDHVKCGLGIDASATNKLYNNIISQCKSAIESFTKDKNRESFKRTILDIKTSHIVLLTEDEKETIKNICYKNLSDENISTIEKNAIETLLKII